jgi:anaerobic magnesium-protoporphyrin IX monomethyl ester cyclase
MVQDRFGAATVAHIKQMTNHRLERDLLTGRLRVPVVTLPLEDAPATSRALRVPLALANR